MIERTFAELLLISGDPALADLLDRDLRGEYALRVRQRPELPGPGEPVGPIRAIVVDLATSNLDKFRDALDQGRRGPLGDHPLVLVTGPSGAIPFDIAKRIEGWRQGVLFRPISARRISELIVPLLVENPLTRLGGPPPIRELKGQRIGFQTRTAALFPVLEELERAAAHDVTLLLVGETGSGKTTLAQLVHELSSRASERFMHLACGALPASLIESELFGHVKGAFTGADRPKVGKFEAVGRGTLLLDEIDALSLEQQVKLLRVIETGEFEPVGSNETRRMESRLIVASNVCLETQVEREKFRKDLFYRLNVLRFDLPALRQRPLDVGPLALEFLAESSNRLRVPIREVHPAFLEAVRRYFWPGNLRELKNCVERAVVLSRDGIIRPESLPSAIANPDPPGSRPRPFGSFPSRSPLAPPPTSAFVAHGTGGLLDQAVATSEQLIIEDALRRHRFKRAAVARELGISRVTLYKKMRRYGLLDRPNGES